jgi:hypothetical protein
MKCTYEKGKLSTQRYCHTAFGVLDKLGGYVIETVFLISTISDL